MTNSAPAIRFVLYSEDRADANQDFAVLREILRGMLKHLCPDVKMNHVDIGPYQPVPSERICGSDWKVTGAAKPGAQERRRQLIRDVAAEIQREKIVFFHVDADAVWSQRTECEHVCKHWPRFLRDVATVLERNNRHPFTGNPLPQRLILAMPFYEIESWAFANTAYLRRILENPADLSLLAKWEADLSLLDEEANIKNMLTIRDSCNSVLVLIQNGFPADTLATLTGSYAETLGRLRGSPLVLQGLENAAGRPY